MSSATLPDNPFVGLRPFETDESLLFFGRQEQTVALLQSLHHHGFVAVSWAAREAASRRWCGPASSPS